MKRKSNDEEPCDESVQAKKSTRSSSSSSSAVTRLGSVSESVSARPGSSANTWSRVETRSGVKLATSSNVGTGRSVTFGGRDVEIEPNHDQYNCLPQRVTDEKRYLTKMRSRLEDRRLQLEDDKRQLQDNKRQLQVDKRQLQDNKRQLQDDERRLQDEIDELYDRVDNATDSSTRSPQIQRKEEQMLKLDKELDILNNQIHDLDSQIQKELDVLNSQIQVLDSQIYDLDSKINDLDSQILSCMEIMLTSRSSSSSSASSASSSTGASASRDLITGRGQHSASTFALSSMIVHGGGYLLSSSRFDPFHQSYKVFDKLVPGEDEITEGGGSLLTDYFFEKENYMEPTQETGFSNGSQKMFLAFERICGVCLTGTNSLTDLSSAVGLCSKGSGTDFGWVVTLFNQSYLLGLIEMKGPHMSLLWALRQAACVATHIAVMLLKKGLQLNDIVVPTVACNGHIIQFGAIVLLDNSFPVAMPVSKVFCLVSDEAIINAHLRRCRLQIKQLQTLIEKNLKPIEVPEMALSMESYHLKILNSDVVGRGIGMFNDQNMMVGMNHMFRALNKLYTNVNARPHVVFPLAIRTSDENLNHHCFIFEDMTKKGYHVGTPHKVKQPKVFKRFIEKFKQVVDYIHEAGVLHCDLFPSNVMWKTEKLNEIDIVIIDWDAAHCLDEKKFAPEVLNKLQVFMNNKAEFNVNHDLNFIKALQQKCNDKIIWDGLASENRESINAAFTKLWNMKYILRQNRI